MVPLSLLLNFSPIEFADAEIEAGVFPYGVDGDQVLQYLRHQNWATHVFRRDGPDHIIAVPIAEGAQNLGEQTKKIRLKENLGLSASLIRNSLINYLAGLPRIVLNYDPIRFVAQDDVMRSSFSRPYVPELARRAAAIRDGYPTHLFLQTRTVHRGSV
jgi:hypothetical protein